MRGQGLWAFVALVAAEAPSGTRVVTGSSVPLSTAPVTVRGALLAAWTDLVVAALRRPEVS